MPPLHAVRSSQYKFVKTYCDELTEEFYDLTADPKENTNEINNAAYATLITTYRSAMDSIKLALGDTDPAPVNCFLSNPQFSKEVNEEVEEYNVKNVEIYPNPASRYFTVHFNDQEREDIEVWITNLVDEKVYYKKMTNTNSFSIIVDGKDWTAGLYLVSVKKGTQLYTRKFTMQ